jgi:membrane associated rhomboid family serine protease
VVVAAIGLVALLLQIALYNRRQSQPVPVPSWLNILGILCAALALFAGPLHLRPQLAQAMAFGAIGAFSISAAIIMRAMRKRTAK